MVSVTPRPCPACEQRGDVSRQDETLTRCGNEECDVRLYRTRPGWSVDTGGGRSD